MPGRTDPRLRPDVLVLGGGGVLGEAWMSGVLAGLEDSAELELSRCEYFVGTSAGSIVAARLAGGVALERPPARADPQPAPDDDTLKDPRAPARAPAFLGQSAALAGRLGATALALGAPLIPAGLTLSAPAGSIARAMALSAMRGRGTLGDLRRRIDATGARFDGRLRVVAVARASGRRVVFGRPRAPQATVGQAVEASCTVPWLFTPVRIGGVEYVDGGVWSPTNLDVAPAGRGAHVLCLSPTAGLSVRDPVMRAARDLSRSVTAVEAAALRGRGGRVVLVVPDAASAAVLGRDLMAHAPRAGVLAAGYRQGLALGE